MQRPSSRALISVCYFRKLSPMPCTYLANLDCEFKSFLYTSQLFMSLLIPTLHLDSLSAIPFTSKHSGSPTHSSRTSASPLDQNAVRSRIHLQGLWHQQPGKLLIFTSTPSSQHTPQAHPHSINLRPLDHPLKQAQQGNHYSSRDYKSAAANLNSHYNSNW
jgi:hypothetical protein